MSNDLTEIEIIEAAQHGDLDAFNTLILQYQDFLYRVAARIVQDDDLAGDAIQDACLLAFRKLASYRGGSFRNWLARIVVNVCYDELRRQKQHPMQSLEPTTQNEDEISSPYWLADYSANPEIHFETTEFRKAIQRCLELLSPRHRMVLVLIDMETMSYEEAAEVLAIPVGTIKSRLARARMQMRDILQTSTEPPSFPYGDISIAVQS